MLNPQKDFLSFILPVYNEAESAEQVIEGVKNELNKLEIPSEIFVVDDASQDGTQGVLEKISGIRLLRNPYNLGYGASLKKALKMCKGNWVMIMDCDSTYPIEKIRDFFQYVPEYDMVVGVRSSGADGSGRKFAKNILKFISSYLSGKKIPDLNSGMRLFQKDTAMEFYDYYPDRFSFTSTLTMCFFTHNYTVKYIPIPYYARKGASHIRPWHFFDFLALLFRLILYFRPLKMLAFPIIALFLLGVAKGIKDIIVTGAIGNLALILILFSFQIFITTLVLEIVNQRRMK